MTKVFNLTGAVRFLARHRLLTANVALLLLSCAVLAVGVARRPSKAHRELLQRLADAENGRGSAEAFIELQKVNGPELLRPLNRILRGRRGAEDARVYAAALIGELALEGDDKAAQLLLDALEDPEVRGAGRGSVHRQMDLLATHRADAVVPQLLRLFLDEGYETFGGFSSYEILWDTRTEAVAAGVVEELMHPRSPEARRRASYLCLTLGGVCVAPLVELLKSESPDVRNEAVSLLRTITGKDLPANYEAWKRRGEHSPSR